MIDTDAVSEAHAHSKFLAKHSFNTLLKYTVLKTTLIKFNLLSNVFVIKKIASQVVFELLLGILLNYMC